MFAPSVPEHVFVTHTATGEVQSAPFFPNVTNVAEAISTLPLLAAPTAPGSTDADDHAVLRPLHDVIGLNTDEAKMTHTRRFLLIPDSHMAPDVTVVFPDTAGGKRHEHVSFPSSLPETAVAATFGVPIGRQHLQLDGQDVPLTTVRGARVFALLRPVREGAVLTVQATSNAS
jgi:hypothetical protein